MVRAPKLFTTHSITHRTIACVLYLLLSSDLMLSQSPLPSALQAAGSKQSHCLLDTLQIHSMFRVCGRVGLAQEEHSFKGRAVAFLPTVQQTLLYRISRLLRQH